MSGHSKWSQMFKRISLNRFFSGAFSRIDKRRRFILASFFLSLLMLFSSFLSFSQLRYFLLVMAALTYFATFFAILENIDKIEWLMLFIHPVCFTIAFDVFYFLLPIRWLTRIPFTIMYGISIYAILLAANIFNVGAAKSIQLFRVAFSVNFLFLTITSFLIFNLILSFRLSFLLDFIFILALVFPLVLQFLWSINPMISLEKQLVKYALLVALFTGEVGLVFSFVPIRSVIFGLFLTACFYSLSGLFHAYIERRLFNDRIREFLFVLIFVFIIILFTIQW